MKLYFIAAGYSRDIVLKEVKGYPMHFCRALEYIAQRMNSAATTSLRSASVGQTPQVDVKSFYSSAVYHIQDCTFLVARCQRGTIKYCMQYCGRYIIAWDQASS